MSKLFLISVVLFGLMAHAGEIKPSFSCGKASLPDEKLICADVDLATIDVELDRTFKIASGRTDEKSKASLKREQKHWIESRWKGCSNGARSKAKECLLATYRNRIAALRGGPDGFARVDYYSENDPHGILHDQVISEALKKLLGKHYGRFAECMDSAEMYEKDKDGFGARAFPGSVNGLGTLMEAIAVIDPKGRMWIALIDEVEKIPYFTNAPEYRSKLPKTIEAWMKTWDGKQRLMPESVVYMSKMP